MTGNDHTESLITEGGEAPGSFQAARSFSSANTTQSRTFKKHGSSPLSNVRPERHDKNEQRGVSADI